MQHGSLFSGIGGFDLAAEWMGWTNVFHCEINPFCQQVLTYHYPNATSYTNIKETDFSVWNGAIDVVSGGFPCQPYSNAGKRLGKEDDRHLWPEMLRAIREISPRWVVGENVRGLVNWSGGLVFHEVQADLESAGYEVQPFLLPACAVDAPHRRDRIWFVAYRADTGAESVRFKRENAVHGFEAFAHTYGAPTEHEIQARGNMLTSMGRDVAYTRSAGWEEFPTQSPLCSGDDGLPGGLDGIAFSKWRNESIKAAGNAIVPQVALQIFKSIQDYETLKK